ncbi:MAG: crossover junction endodeoxyribonuclease RuvC [Mycetocola sp.]
MTLRVLGVDPGLTRCGIGIVDVEPNRKARLVSYTVIRSAIDAPIDQRLLVIGRGLDAALDEFLPQAVAVERVFAQHNLRTVMGTAQVSGLALHAAAKRDLRVGLHTPSEVKAAITGYGSADKKQVATMVARVLGLAEPPQPADAADALALAICHAWRGGIPASGGAATTLTPAQEAWAKAEKAARGGR